VRTLLENLQCRRSGRAICPRRWKKEAKNVLTTTFVTTTVWILLTLLTAPEPNGILLSFYRKVPSRLSTWI
jgi:hypothetical protein